MTSWDDVGLKEQEIKRAALRKALEAAGGNVSRAAAAIGLSRRQAARLIVALELADFAAEARLANGGHVDGGRPKKEEEK